MIDMADAPMLLRQIMGASAGVTVVTVITYSTIRTIRTIRTISTISTINKTGASP